MEIEFSLKRKEYEEFVKVAYDRISRISKAGNKMFIINIVVWVFFGIGFASVMNFYEKYEYLNFLKLNIGISAFLASMLVFIGANIFQQRLYLKHSINENGRMLQLQKLQISDQGFMYQTNDCEQLYKWSAIQEFEESKNLYCFYIDNNQALIVPKRTVNAAGQSEKLLKYANASGSFKTF